MSTYPEKSSLFWSFFVVRRDVEAGRQLENVCFLLMFLTVGCCTDSVFVSVEYEEPHSEICPRDENARMQTVDLPSDPFALLRKVGQGGGRNK